MGLKFITESILQDIADAIRGKDGTSALIEPVDFAQRITDIPSGGGGNTELEALMAGTATGSVTVDGVKDLSMCKLIMGPVSGSNSVTELHFPDLEVWYGDTGSDAERNGGLSDPTRASQAASSAALQILDLPKCQALTIGYALGGNNANVFQNLHTLNAPNLESIYGSLRGCGLLAFNFPKLERMPTSGFFREVQVLKEIRLPMLGEGMGFGSYQCYNCSMLELADIGKITMINNAFIGTATSLKALVLRHTQYGNICSLASGTDLANSPIASGTGYIYVPRDLIARYQSATNWTVYSAQFRALEDYTDDGTISGNFVAPV